MEIKGHSFDDRSKPVGRADITRPNREVIAESNPPLSPPRERPVEESETAIRDRVEVSETGRRISERVKETDRKDDGTRVERLRELKEAHQRGELNTDERVERSAIRLLESQ